MKKQLGILAVAVLSVALVGCKDAHTTISNADEAIITVDGKKITKADIYETAKKNAGVNVTLSQALYKVCDKEGIKVSDAMKKEAQEQVDMLKTSAKDKFQEQLKAAGFKDEKEFIETQIYPKLKLQELSKKYVREHKEELYKTYTPMKLEIVEFATKEKADAALPEIKKGKALKDFADAQTGFDPSGSSVNYIGKVNVYTAKSNLPTAILDEVKASSTNGLVNKVISDASTGKAFIVNIIEKQPAKFEKEAIDAIISTGATELNQKISADYLDKYDFEVFDKELMDGFKQAYPDLVD